MNTENATPLCPQVMKMSAQKQRLTGDITVPGTGEMVTGSRKP